MENQKVRPNETSLKGKAITKKGTTTRRALRDSAPAGTAKPRMPTLVCARHNRFAMQEVLHVCRTASSASRTRDDHSQTVLAAQISKPAV